MVTVLPAGFIGAIAGGIIGLILMAIFAFWTGIICQRGSGGVQFSIVNFQQLLSMVNSFLSRNDSWGRFFGREGE